MSPIQRQSVIRIVAAIIQDNVGRVLLVRKRGTLKFMQLGGKCMTARVRWHAPERELREELMCGVPGSAQSFWAPSQHLPPMKKAHLWRRRSTARNSLAP